MNISKSINNEVWKTIQDYPAYKVSSLGRVQSIRRDLIMKNQKLPNGYEHVPLSKGGVKKTYRVHRLVACTFLGESLSTKKLVCHKNDIRNDNKLSNLFLGTHKDNYYDSVAKGRHTKGSTVAVSKLKENQVVEIRSLRGLGASNKIISEMFGVSVMTVWNIVTRKTWKHI